MMDGFAIRRSGRSGRAMSVIWATAFSVLGLSNPATADDGMTNDVGTRDMLVEAASSRDAVPKGLTDSDWTGIRREYERHRHAAVNVDGGFRARNLGQQWLTHFDGCGFIVQPATPGVELTIGGVEPSGADWRWGLELQSCGFPGYERVVDGQAAMSAQDDRVTYDWGGGLREWFVNDRRGLEHGFTLDVRPPGAGDPQVGASDPQVGVNDWLELRLAVRGGLRPHRQSDGRGVSFVDEKGGAVVHYNGLKVWDADQRELPARLELDDAGLRLSIDERQARYPLTVDPFAQQAYLKASNTGADDSFGWSVAVSGGTVVVGAPDEDSNATGVNGDQANNSLVSSGAAYVFVRDGGVWSQQAYLKASNTGNIDNFGLSVALSGDTIVVGANLERSAATGVNGDQANNDAFASGAAYVFVRDGGGVWSQQAYLKASNTGASDTFGSSVSVSGDTVVVGSPAEDSNATEVNGNQTNNRALNSGAAYVFVRDGGGVWSQQAYLKASNTGSGDWFGISASVSGDTVVVGARYENSNATGVDGDQTNNSALDSGAAYVFVRDGGGVWSQQAYLKASNTNADDRFGASVVVSGDTIVVGTYLEDSNATGVNGDQTNNSATDSGAAFVFKRNAAVWSQEAYLKGSDTGAEHFFGFSATVSGNTIIVGAPGQQGSSGAAYVFVRDGGDWSQQAYLKASNTGANDLFGRSVAVSGDTVVVGAIWEDGNATGVNGDQNDNSAEDSGAAYVFIIPPCGNGTEDSGEECDDGNTMSGDCCSAGCTFESGATQCRPSAGVCDVAEFCDGAGNCPLDGFQPSTFECRAPTGDCDPAENCTGSSATCPANGFAPAGTACGIGSDTACDHPDTCNGSGACNSNHEPAGTLCRAFMGPCDVVEVCDGGGNCPADGFTNSGVCRPATGPCDVAESCNGAGPDCPGNGFASGTVCRPSTGDCDPAESCDGAGANCQADALITTCINGDSCCPAGCTDADDVDCDATSIPTVSEWGLAILALLLLAGAKLHFSRRVSST